MASTKNQSPAQNREGRSLSDLTDILFDQMDRLNNSDLHGEELAEELDRSKAIASVAGQIISNANTTIHAWELRNSFSSGGIEMPKMLEA